ncbi:hypothetical protein, partial [[Phormidium] sp. LEGE 05292]|uniref:hypothetical protein n=1 Tax=[Phormidium] sp. LEGE 05292 TaxID=767427 RepID=UPI001D152148
EMGRWGEIFCLLPSAFCLLPSVPLHPSTPAPLHLNNHYQAEVLFSTLKSVTDGAKIVSA